MAKKQKPPHIKLPQVDVEAQALPDIIELKTTNGYNYLSSETREKLGKPDYVPGHLRIPLNPWVRNKRNLFDQLTEMMESSDKASDEYMAAETGREKVAEALIMAKSQIEDYKKGTIILKDALGAMSKGTQDSHLYTNMLVFGAQADGISFDDNGKLSFAGKYASPAGSPRGSDKDIKETMESVATFNLDDMKNPTSGGSPIITQPYDTQQFIWGLADETKRNQELGKKFDYDWMYTRLYNDLTNRGSQNTIGLAFADLAGDNQTKSFAEQYDDGLADPLYYIHPLTGQPLPKDSSWMKDPKNADILKNFLGKYVTEVMKEVYGEIDKETLQVKKTPGDLAREIVEKYNK